MHLELKKAFTTGEELINLVKEVGVYADLQKSALSFRAGREDFDSMAKLFNIDLFFQGQRRSTFSVNTFAGPINFVSM